MNLKTSFVAVSALAALAIALPWVRSQEEGPAKAAAETGKKNKKKGGKGQKGARLDLPVTVPFATLNQADRQEDFPAMCLNGDGQPIVVFIEHREDADTLKLASLNAKGRLVAVAEVSEPGISNIYQPCLTMLPNGRMLCVWSQLEADGQWDLMARTIGRKGLAAIGDPVRITKGSGNDIFADLGRDRHGRVWVTWQRVQRLW